MNVWINKMKKEINVDGLRDDLRAKMQIHLCVARSDLMS